MFTQPRPRPSVRAVKRNESIDGLVASRGVNVSLSLGVFLICGKMARIMCCALDVYSSDEAVAVDGGTPPPARHSEGYVHKG